MSKDQLGQAIDENHLGFEVSKKHEKRGIEKREPNLQEAAAKLSLNATFLSSITQPIAKLS